MFSLWTSHIIFPDQLHSLCLLAILPQGANWTQLTHVQRAQDMDLAAIFLYELDVHDQAAVHAHLPSGQYNV